MHQPRRSAGPGPLARARFAFALLAGLVLSAATTAPTPPAQASQQPQFEASVNRVRVDVIVTDDDGNFVEDLSPQDFRLFEDGIEQQILQAQLVNLEAGFIRNLSTLTPSATGSANAEDAEPDAVTSAAEEASLEAGDFGAMVYVLDIGRLGYWERRRFARGWAELLEQTESLGFPRAVYMIDYLGYLRELAPLTYDVDMLRELSGNLLTAVYTSSDQDWVFEHPDWQSNLSDTRDEGSTAAASRIRDREGAVDTAGFLAAICDSLLGRQGRKALVWVSPGVRISSSSGISQRAYEAWEELQRRSNAANVSIYGLDPTLANRRQERRRWTRIDSKLGGPVESLQRDPLETSLTNYDALRDSLTLAANWTGGKAYPFRTQVGQVLQEIEADTGHFYLLAYATPPPLGDGEYHEVKVEVVRPDLEVRARQGYVDHSGGDRRELVASSSLALPGSVDDLPLTAGAFYTWTEEGEPEIQVAVDVGGLVNALDPVPEHPGLQLYFAAVSGDRELLDSTSHIVSWNAGEQEAGSGATGIPSVYLHRWPLGYGRFDLRILAIDEESGRMGAAKVGIEVPEAVTEPRVSQPLLLTPDAGGLGPLEPVLDERADEGTDVRVFFEVYGQIEPEVVAHIVRAAPAAAAPADVTAAEGNVPEGSAADAVQEQPLELDVYFTREPESHILKVWLPVPVGLQPGPYVIEVRVAAPGGEGERVFELALRIEG